MKNHPALSEKGLGGFSKHYFFFLRTVFLRFVVVRLFGFATLFLLLFVRGAFAIFSICFQ